MSRNYTVPGFFRQIDKSYLKRYFQEQGLFKDFDFDVLTTRNVEPLFAAWKALPEDKRQSVDSVSQEIFYMDCEKGFHAIRDAAQWKMHNSKEAFEHFNKSMSDLPGHQDRAMVTYLDHQELWQTATTFYHADSLSYWRKRGNMGHTPAKTDAETLQKFARKIGAYFHLVEGRGENCTVEYFPRGERDYFFAYPEDFSRQNLEWRDGKFDRRSYKPAFEVVFVYNRTDGTLDLNLRGSKKPVEVLQNTFATVILGLNELPYNTKDEGIYDLKSLAERDFTFVYDTDSEIKDLFVENVLH